MYSANCVRVLLGIVVCCVVWLFFNPVAVADGGVMPAATIRKIPEIPRQRAVLTWRDGVERMVVESTFKGDGDKFGWVIPLPAVPTRFTSESPGYVGEFARLTTPDVTHSRSISEDLGLLLGAVFVIMLLGILFYRPGLTPLS